MKKIISFVMVMCMVLVMAGCGSSASTAQTAAAPDAGAPAAAASGDVKTISFWHKYCQPGQVEVFEQICKDFETLHPDIKIEITTTTDDDIKTKLQVALANNALPDVYQTWSGEYCEKFARAGYALDLTPYMTDEWKNSFYTACYTAFAYDGKQYAVPTRFDAELFVYKKSIFEKYGLSEPKTWADLLNICEVLKSNGETPFILGDGLTWDAPHWYGALWQRCVPEAVLEGQDFNIKTVKCDDPGYVKGLGYFSDLLEKGYFLDNCVSLEHNMAMETFYAGEGAMMYVEVVEFTDIYNGLNGDFGFFAMPTIDGEPGNQNKIFGAPEGMIVNSKSSHVDESVEFLKYLTSPEIQKKLVKEAKHTSSTVGATTTDNSVQQLVDVMDCVLNFEGMSNWTDCALEASLVDVMRAKGQEFYAQQISAEEYMDAMKAQADSVRAANQ